MLQQAGSEKLKGRNAGNKEEEMKELGQLIQIDVHLCTAQEQMCWKMLVISTGAKLFCLDTDHTSKRSPGQRLD